MRSGISIDDLYCGIFCNSIGNYYGRSGWSVGAALLWLHIILFVVVVLTMVPVVVYFILLLAMIFLLLAGMLVLLYHCTHYTLRSSSSTHGAYCGVFSVGVHVAVDIARWDVGTAL